MDIPPPALACTLVNETIVCPSPLYPQASGARFAVFNHTGIILQSFFGKCRILPDTGFKL